VREFLVENSRKGAKFASPATEKKKPQLVAGGAELVCRGFLSRKHGGGSITLTIHHPHQERSVAERSKTEILSPTLLSSHHCSFRITSGKAVLKMEEGRPK